MAREAIFIGYRRDDTADVAGRIFDALESRFGRDHIFKDVDNLHPGADFAEYINHVLPRCRVALILIGPNWVNAQDEDGHRRLDDPHDWVRTEIEIALAAGDLDVVPVLINGARMPRAEELPPSLHPLLRRHAATIRRDPDFRDDIARLSQALEQRLYVDLSAAGAVGIDSEIGPAPVQRLRQSNRMPMLIWAGFAAALALVAFGYGVLRGPPPPGVPTLDEQNSSVESQSPVDPGAEGGLRERPLAQSSPPTPSVSGALPEPTGLQEPIREQERVQAPTPQSERVVTDVAVATDGAAAPADRDADPQQLLGSWRLVAQRGGCLVGLEVREATPTRLRVRLAGAAVSNAFRVETNSDDRIIYRESSFHLGSASRLTWFVESNRLVFSYPGSECSYVRQ